MRYVDSRFRVCFTREDCLVPELRLAGWCRFAKADRWAMPPHHHGSAFEIHLLLRGRLDLVVDNQIATARAGEAVITRPHEIHMGLRRTIPQCEFFWFQFLPENLDDVARQTLSGLAKKRMFRTSKAVMASCERIINEHLREMPGAVTATSALVQLMLADIERSSMDTESSLSESIEKVIHILKSDPAASISRPQLAAKVKMSATSLSSRFQSEVGETLGKWFLHYRLDLAREILASGTSPSEASRALGFSTPQNFSTVFRREYGVAPLEFIELAKSGFSTPETAPELD